MTSEERIHPGSWGCSAVIDTKRFKMSVWGDSFSKVWMGNVLPTSVNMHLVRERKRVETSCTTQISWCAVSPAQSHTTFQWSEHKKRKATGKLKHRQPKTGKIQAFVGFVENTRLIGNIQLLHVLRIYKYIKKKKWWLAKVFTQFNFALQTFFLRVCW